ncbi:hypothetical protein A9Q82_00145 [Cycloclasticus sp. 46_120_T64]|nr:hypothetical protein A9Q82_00145 [Cycloclasticus sp. 46_120_T64]
MKLVKQSPIKVFKLELIQLLAAIVFTAFILTLSTFYADDVDQQMLSVTSQQGWLNAEIDRLIDDEALLNDMGTRFERLKEKGFYGREDRLAWTEVLKQVSERLKLPNFKYSIEPQQNISNIGSGFQSNLGLSVSVMKIEAGLLHEADFSTIVQQLSDFAPGIFRVEECKITKEGVISLSRIKRNFGIDCTLAWYTVTPPTQSGVNK